MDKWNSSAVGASPETTINIFTILFSILLISILKQTINDVVRL